MKMKTIKISIALLGVTSAMFLSTSSSQALSPARDSAYTPSAQCLAAVEKQILSILESDSTAQFPIDLAKGPQILATISPNDCERLQDQLNLSPVIQDVTAVGQQVTAIVSDYTSFGKSNASNGITLTHLKVSSSGNTVGVLAFGKMVAAQGFGRSSASGPGVTGSTNALGKGERLSSGNYVSGTSLNWCIVVSSFDKISNTYYSAKFTNKGLGDTKIGNVALTCRNGA